MIARLIVEAAGLFTITNFDDGLNRGSRSADRCPGGVMDLT